MKFGLFRSKKPINRILKFLLANLVLALVITIVVFKGFSQGAEKFGIYLIWAFVISFTQWSGHSYIYGKLDQRISWRENSLKRAIIGSFAIIVYAVFAYLVVQIIMYLIVYGKLPENQLYWILRSSYIAIVVSFAISIFSAAMGFLRSWKESVQETESVKAEMLRYKYESLQNQINPHFLFNSFNVLSDLVYEDRKKAVDFIGQLGQLFRYVLESRDKELVPVAEELAFISAFSFLLQTRFEEKLTIAVNVDSTADEMLVPMTLQLLIENCVKHNEISASNPLHIRVYREDSMICVVNNRQPKALEEGSTGKGLNNLVQQYRFFTERLILINETKEDFTVKIPVLKTNDK